MKPSKKYKEGVERIRRETMDLINTLYLSDIINLLCTHYKTKDRAVIIKEEYRAIFLEETRKDRQVEENK